jgi:two-component system, cell cycle sensor histidine kinase and response regulator CckA
MKNKMTAAVLLLVIAVMTSTAFTAFLYFEKKYKESVALDQFALLQAAAAQIDERLFDAMVALDTLADSVTPDVVALPGGAQRFVDRRREDLFFNDSINIYSPSGTLLAAAAPHHGSTGRHFNASDNVSKTIETGKICISPPFNCRGKDRSHPVVEFTSPAYDAAHRLIAVVGGSVDLRTQHYIRQLAALKLGHRGYLTLYDANGTILMHPHRGRVLERPAAGADQLLEMALRGFQGSRETVNAEGVEVIRSVTRLKSTGWILAATYRQADAYAPIKKATHYLLAVGAAAALFSTVVVWLSMRHLLAPLQFFTRHIEELPEKDGEEKLVKIDSDDEIGTLAGAFNSLLEHLEQEKRNHREQKEFAESLVKNCSLPTFVIDPQHTLLFWNRACEDLTGVASEDVLGTDRHRDIFYGFHRPTIADLIADGEVDYSRALYEELWPSSLHESAWCSEGWFRGMPEGDRYLILTAAPVCSRDGEIAAVIETVQDITERKLAEEAQQQAFELLRESEEKYMRVVNNIPVGVSIINRNMEIVSSNPQMRRWFPAVTAASRPTCYKVFNDASRDCVCDNCPTSMTLLDGEVHEETKERVTHEGVKTYRIIASPIKNSEGEVIAAVDMVIDLTEQKKLEQQLRQSQKMEAIGTLAGGIAHDFNNILTAISAYCSLIERNTDDDRVHKYLGKLTSSAERATALTRSLLAYSRNQPLNRQPVDLNAVLTKVEHLLSRLINEDIELTVLTAGRKLIVLADTLQLEQLLINLCTNARDAMPEGGLLRIATDSIEIGPDFIRMHGYGHPGRYAVVTVADSGCGMDAATRDRIFEPFFTTKEVGKGTGLGLSMVYGIVQQHNGYVSVYSEPANGSIFTIYLPLLQEEMPLSAQGELPAPARGEETILLVEDDAEIRSSLNELLTEEGYRVFEAVDGEDGVNKFCEHADVIDLIIMDVVMPRKNGRVACEQIRMLRPGMKTLFISGYTADILQVKGVLPEDVNFVSKPVQIKGLLAKIRGVLDC